jgi:hypothetical protein
MSSGGMAQLVAVGAQDVWLTGNSEISFFQSVYKRHTNFSQVVSKQVLRGEPTPNGMSTIKFDKSGDLMGYVYITAVCMDKIFGVPASYQTVDWTQIIDKVELYIGGQLIDSQTSEFSEYLAPSLFAQNNTKSPSVQNHGGSGPESPSLFYPMRFWFCENFQSALPLIALRYHDIEMRVYWNANVKTSDPAYKDESGETYYPDINDATTIINFELYSQNMYLDVQERKSMSTKTHNLLITQVQRMNPTGTKVMPIVFNHPIKYICASGGLYDSITVRDKIPIPSTGSAKPIDIENSFKTQEALTSYVNQVLIQINGIDIGDYKYACPHFTQIPSYYHVPFSQSNSRSYFIVPFCLETSKFQPTGSLNFSRLDSFQIMSKSMNINRTVYGVNYNILRIQNGMGGLMYSN